MVLIFIGSTDLLASRHTSRFIGPLIRMIYPQASDELVQAIQAVVRKSGHLTEYALLGALSVRALRKPGTSWNWKQAGQGVALAALYAATDEIHQSFVPTRDGRVTDVLIDTVGAATGVWLAWRIGRLRSWW